MWPPQYFSPSGISEQLSINKRQFRLQSVRQIQSTDKDGEIENFDQIEVTAFFRRGQHAKTHKIKLIPPRKCVKIINDNLSDKKHPAFQETDFNLEIKIQIQDILLVLKQFGREMDTVFYGEW